MPARVDKILTHTWPACRRREHGPDLWGRPEHGEQGLANVVAAEGRGLSGVAPPLLPSQTDPEQDSAGPSSGPRSPEGETYNSAGSSSQSWGKSLRQQGSGCVLG